MVKYRVANESDYEKINKFHNLISNKNRSLEKFLWEFHHCPFGKAIYVVAEDKDEIVGTNAVIPTILLNSKGVKILTGKSEDTLVHPGFRGKNIFEGIYEVLFKASADKGIKSIWGYTSAIKPFKKIGFDCPFYHHQTLLVNDVFFGYNYLSTLNQNNKWMDKFKILMLCTLSKIKSHLNYTRSSKNNFKVTEENTSFENINLMLSEISNYYGNLYFIDNNSSYIQWRIFNNPNYHKIFSFTFFNKQNEPVSYLFFNAYPNGLAFVIQSLFSPALSEKDKYDITKIATISLKKKGIKLIRNWHFLHNQFNRDELRIYKKSGYTHLNRGIYFVWKQIGDTTINPQDILLNRISTEGVI